MSSKGPSIKASTHIKRGEAGKATTVAGHRLVSRATVDEVAGGTLGAQDVDHQSGMLITDE